GLLRARGARVEYGCPVALRHDRLPVDAPSQGLLPLADRRRDRDGAQALSSVRTVRGSARGGCLADLPSATAHGSDTRERVPQAAVRRYSARRSKLTLAPSFMPDCRAASRASFDG